MAEAQDTKRISESSYISNNRGKWSQPNVPHKGWECIKIEDSGELSSICEMCETKSIRYIHYMQHPDYDQILGVGCVCAGNMESNLLRAKRRENFMRSRKGKRKRWINRKWKISQRGNSFIESDGFVVVIKYSNSFWSASIKHKHESSEKWHWIRKKYNSEDQAKLAAFDLLTKILIDMETQK
jgi:hypothetical protein